MKLSGNLLAQKLLTAFNLLLAFNLLIAARANDLPLAGKNKSNNADTRIVSLAPSNTELVYSLNGGDKLVAISDICDYPIEVKAKEKVGNLTSVKMEKIARIKPDLILLVSGQEGIAQILKKHGFRILLLDNSSTKNIGKNLLQIGVVINQEARAKILSSAFEHAVDELKQITAKDQKKPRVFICVWPQPLMSAGKDSFMNEGITIAGGINCTGNLSQPYPRINQEKLLLLEPDMVLVPQEQAKEKFWSKSPWSALKAVKENHVYVLPQHETDCLNRPSLRFVDALYWLAVKMHPDLKTTLDKWREKTIKELSSSSLKNGSVALSSSDSIA